MKLIKITLAIAILLVLNMDLMAQVSDSILHLDAPLEIKPDTNNKVDYPMIHFASSMTKDGLMIRWAPSTKEIWLDGIDYGYILEKFEPTDVDKDTGHFVPVTETPIKPWPLEDWRPIVNKDKPYCAAAAQCIYGQEAQLTDGFVTQSDHQDNLFGFNLLAADLDRDAAIASGLGFIIKDVDTNYFGLYRLRLAQNTLSGYKDTLSKFVVGAYDEYKPVLIDQVKELENRVVIQWYVGPKGSRYTAYYIERSEDNETFIRLNKQPFLNIQTNVTQNANVAHFVDTLEENYTKYYYRVIGVNAFAQESTPSKSVAAMGKDLTPPNTPINVTSQETKEGLVMINWDWKDLNKDNDLQGFQVLKSNDPQGVFDTLNEGLLPAGANKYLDKNPDPTATNYYKILAIDQNGNMAESSLGFTITEDKTAPEAPTNLQGEIDTNGLLLLTWDPPQDKDVRGYLVHFSNGKESNFAVIPGDYLTEAYYVDSISLNTLSESIYYYVVALDLSYNPSVASEVIEVKKPDLIPPMASFFSDYLVGKEGIKIQWVSSNSKDVDKVFLMRRVIDGDWEIIHEIEANQNEYLDKNVVGGTTYEYNLVTMDDAGNESVPAKTLTLEALTPFYIAKVTNLRASKEEEGISLTWDYEPSGDFEFYIYKSVDEGPMKLFKRLTTNTSFMDREINKRTSYKYAVVAKAKDGRKSEMEYVEAK